MTGCGNRRDLNEGTAAAPAAAGSPVSSAPASGVSENSPAAVPAAASVDSGAPVAGSSAASPALAGPKGTQAAARPTSASGSSAAGSTEAADGNQPAPTKAAAPAPKGQAPVPTPGDAPAPAPGSSCTPKCGPVVVGHVGTYSGVFSGFANGPKALEAWAQALNARGGLDGHPVRVIIAEDGGDPARHRALLQQLVEQQGVIAFVDCFCPTTGQAGVDYLTKKGIPMVGGSPSSEWYYDSPMYFPQGSAGKKGVVHAILGGTAEIAVPQGKTKLAVLACNEAQICKNLSGDMPAVAPQFGMKVVSQAQASLAQPDYTAECLAARNAGADVMFLAFDPNSYGRVTDSCKSIGYKPIFSLVPDATNSLTQIDSMDGAIVYSGVFPWFDTAHPSIAEMHRAMKVYTPKAEPDQTAGDDWVAAQLFERAAHGHLSATPTSQDILTGLWTLKDDTIGGLTYPLTFAQGKTAEPKHCWWVAVIHDHKFTSPDQKVRCA
jgi:branched-chain amino acid transport system substrate-binding protein